MTSPAEKTAAGQPAAWRTDRAARPLRWVSVAAEYHISVARHRHLVRAGADTSLCGTTALPAQMWRGAPTKAACPACVQAADKRSLPMPDPADAAAARAAANMNRVLLNRPWHQRQTEG